MSKVKVVFFRVLPCALVAALLAWVILRLSSSKELPTLSAVVFFAVLWCGVYAPHNDMALALKNLRVFDWVAAVAVSLVLSLIIQDNGLASCASFLCLLILCLSHAGWVRLARR